MRKAGSLALAIILCVCLLSVSGVSAAPEDLGQTTAIDFSGFEVGDVPGGPDDTMDSPPDGSAYGTLGWDDGSRKNIGTKFDVEIVSYEGGQALQWTNLVDGNTNTLHINIAPDNLGATDWTGATGLMVWVDTTQSTSQAEIELRVVERSGDGLQSWCSWKDEAGTTLSEYFIWSGSKWTRADTTWGRAKLPQGYKGWVKMALDQSSLTLPWWETSLKGNDDTLDLNDMYAVGMRIQSVTGDKVIIDEIAFIDDTQTTLPTTTTKATTTTTTKATTKADTTTQTGDTTMAADKEEDGSNIVGIIIGVAAAVVVIAAVAAFLVINKKKKAASGAAETPDQPRDEESKDDAQK